MKRKYDFKIIITHRCNAKCLMCDIHKNQTKPKEEICLNSLKKLPNCHEISITGGEPFMRSDLRDIVDLLHEKSKRVMINTNGYFTEKIVSLCQEFPDIGIRVSLDGNYETHNKIRGVVLYERALDTLMALKRIGLKDVGINFTLQERNFNQVMDIYYMSKEMELDCSISNVLNSFAFFKYNNQNCEFNQIEPIITDLINANLNSPQIKDWGRAYFYNGMMRYLCHEDLPMNCKAGIDTFFIDVHGNVLPCNATKKPLIMGNLNDQNWNGIITSNRAKKVINICRNCENPCWSMCNLKTALRKNKWMIAKWVIDKKVKGGKFA